MNATRWIRLIAVVGFYMLFRDYIIKRASKKQAEEHEKAMRPEPQTKAKISPNALRGANSKKVSFETESDEAEDTAKASGPEWGKKAKKRQKQVLKKLQQAEEDHRREEQEDEEDKDIMDLLVDYEEGKDGW